jgi:UDP-N-acetylmuramate dehydrogenase
VSRGTPVLQPQRLSRAFAWMRGQRCVQAPMACYTSLRVGGCADLLLMPADGEELGAIVAWAHERDVPLMCLGNGTNLVVRSGGIRGLVVSLRGACNRLQRLEAEPVAEMPQGAGVRLGVGAGVPLTRLLHLAMRDGLGGLAFMVGIPGTLGGAVMMNAGTEAGSLWDVLESATILLPDGQTRVVRRGDVPVGYRHTGLPTDGVVLEATLRALKGHPEDVREEVRNIYHQRLQTQPLAYPNAGSVFKNPDGEHAGRLIDQLGLKGTRIGAAQVSQQHANFIINLGQASADEVLALIEYVKCQVYDRTGILLEEEVQIVGE